MRSLVFAQGPSGNDTYLLIFVLLLIAVVALSVFLLFARSFNRWIQAKITNANAGLRPGTQSSQSPRRPDRPSS